MVGSVGETSSRVDKGYMCGTCFCARCKRSENKRQCISNPTPCWCSSPTCILQFHSLPILTSTQLSFPLFSIQAHQLSSLILFIGEEYQRRVVEWPLWEEWVKSQNENLDYSPKKLKMNSGTLLIQLYDRRQNRSVWQGYATTVYGGIDFSNQRHLRNAVISILDKYRFWTEGFVEGQAKAQEQEAEL
jgi:hypothetical protein